MTTHTETRWAIARQSGLFVGQWLTRRDAVAAHCKALRLPHETTGQKHRWAELRHAGHRAVKVTMTYEYPDFRDCVVCEKRFERGRTDQIYCSCACRMRAFRKREKAKSK